MPVFDSSDDEFIFLNCLTVINEDSEYHYVEEWYKSIDNLSEHQFHNIFRMSKRCFSSLIDLIIEKYSIKNLAKKLRVFIFFISHKTTYRLIQEQFGVSKSTLFDWITELAVVMSSIAHEKIKFPTKEEYEELTQGFEEICGVKNCLLALDGTEIQISRPNSQPFSYYNRHDIFSVKFLCAIDYKLRFRGVSYGFGASHDSFVYSASRLRDKIENISDRNVFILADSAFTGFRNIVATVSTINFPISEQMLTKYKKMRIKVENAFGLFKGKFKRFSGRIIFGHSDKSIRLIKASIFIHNFIIEFNE
ncbi:putative nuclease HARBI1 [Pseudoloma neurophilia]|uniref:Putative nuclease HARBI1 n=1 Tax=Pseudoloma neurophilia TaxID=146866 RepID=A0A0R0M564_9MICR|nr:putative nuclease HARBI1 [Pseudoloma neurophilia]